MNRKAQVTLDNVYPRRADTNTLIKDIKELLQMNFAEKLRKITVKKGAKFVDYRPETGSWVFKVDHFSRYGFNDSDEEAEGNDKEMQKKKAEEAKKPDSGAKKIGEEPPKVDQSKKKDEGKEVQVGFIIPLDPSLEHRLAKPILEKRCKISSPIVHVSFQASFGMDLDIFMEDGDQFNPDEDLMSQSMYADNVSEDDYHVVPQGVPLHLPYYDPSTKSTSKTIQIMKSTLFADDDRSSDGRESRISSMTSYLDIPEEIQQLPIIREEVMPQKKTILRPKVDKVYNFGGKRFFGDNRMDIIGSCLVAGLEASSGIIPTRTYMDLGMFKGKSFKVGWARGFDFFTPNTISEANRELSQNTIDIGIYSKDFDPLKVRFYRT